MASTGGFGRKLAAFKKNWKKAAKQASEERGAFAELDDGTYLMRLTGAECRLSQSNNFGASFEFTVVRGECKGQKYFLWCALSSDPKDLKKIARTLSELGVDDVVDLDPEELESVLKKLVKEKVCVRTRLRTGEPTDKYPDPRQWFNILKVVETDEDDDEDDEDEKPSKKSKDDDDEEDEDSEESDEDSEETEEEEKFTPSKGDVVAVDSDDGVVVGSVKKVKGQKILVETADEEIELKMDDCREPTKKELKAYEAESEESSEEDEDAEESSEDDEDEKPTKKKSKKSDEEDEEDEEEEEDEKSGEAEVEKGSKVSFKVGKKEIEGTVIKIDEEAGELRVKDIKGKVHTVAADDAQLLVEEEDDE